MPKRKRLSAIQKAQIVLEAIRNTRAWLSLPLKIEFTSPVVKVVAYTFN